jgi:type IV secretion system protein VirD4
VSASGGVAGVGLWLSEAPARLRRLNWKQWVIVALWALFMLWTAWGTVSNGAGALFGTRPASPFEISYAAPMFAFNLWGFAAGLVFGLGIANPFAWLNGKRLVFACTAFAMILGRLVGGGAAGLLLYAQSINGMLIFLGTPFVLLFAGSAVIVAIGMVVGAVFGFFVGVPVLLFNQIFAFERSLQIYRFQSTSLAGRIARLVLWLRNEQSPDALPDDSKGARFATLREIEALHAPDDPAAMAFGHIGMPLFLKTEKHILIQASTRSGKGVTLIIPHLLRYQGSAFVLDPKGENAKATIRRRRTLNNKVHVLDPFGITGLPQARFNPLSRFTPQNMEAESKALAAALFVVGERERDHWNAAGQQLLAAIILYVYASPDIPPARKDLPMVRKLLLGSINETLDAMVEIDDAEGLLRDLALSFKATPEREFGSIVSTAQRQTEILDNPFMIACLSATGPGEEVDFKAWKRGTMTVYLCLSAPKFPTFNRWLRLLLTSALDEMTDTLAPPKLPVCFMLDELATLGHLDAVENAVGLAAGYGIQLVSVFQDVAQMKDLYKGRWASFVGNAGVRALFNLDDLDTADYWSKFIGGRLVESRSQQQDIYGFSKGENVGENMRPLISTDRMMMDFASNNDPRRPDKMLVLAQGAHPIVTDRVAYFHDEGLGGLWDDPRRPVSGSAAQTAHQILQPPAAPAPVPSPAPVAPQAPAWQAQSQSAPAAAPVAGPASGGMLGGLFSGPALPASSAQDHVPPAEAKPAAVSSFNSRLFDDYAAATANTGDATRARLVGAIQQRGAPSALPQPVATLIVPPDAKPPRDGSGRRGRR